ncbi:MAG: DUF2202 domain-containing protein [Paludibacter sp.]|nr:DUF2202 domain-containing protein [Paludibacter sp.]
MKNLFLFSTALFTALVISSCNSDDLNLQAAEVAESNYMYEMNELPTFSSPVNEISQTEIDGLIQMREEEKLALDVYDSFYDSYKLVVFDRISNSESRHTTAVLSLINYFGLSDPAKTEIGQFSNADIQTLYDQLIAAGNSSVEALKIGAYIEEYDIADLKELINETENIDIKTVYSHLLRGSENHLRAFVRNLKVRGTVYEHQLLNSDDYDTILKGESIAPVLDSAGNCINN